MEEEEQGNRNYFYKNFEEGEKKQGQESFVICDKNIYNVKLNILTIFKWH